MAGPPEPELGLSEPEPEPGRERPQVFGVLRLQEERTGMDRTGPRPSDGRWQAPIFALARKASETLSGGIHGLPRAPETRTQPDTHQWGGAGKNRVLQV